MDNKTNPLRVFIFFHLNSEQHKILRKMDRPSDAENRMEKPTLLATDNQHWTGPIL